MAARSVPRAGNSLNDRSELSANRENHGDKTRGNPIFWFLIPAVFFVPLVVSSRFYDSFTLPKAALVRSTIVAMLIVWLLTAIRRRVWHRRRTKLDLPVIVFMLAALAAAALSTDHRLSLLGHYKRYEDIFTLFAYGTLYFIVVVNIGRSQARGVTSVWLVSGALVGAYGLAQYFGYEVFRTGVADGR